MSGQKYGDAIPDQVDHIAANFDAHLELIGDIRDVYRERAAIEREYAGKLQLLAKRASDKKSKLMSTVVLGEDPTKAWTESTLSQSTLDSAYSGIVQSLVSTSQDHINIADALGGQVVDALKQVERKNEETTKNIMQFYQKLLSDRDRAYADRLKSKHKYDEECLEVETYRQKHIRAQDDRHADRAAKNAEQQRTEMMNSKNVYLISTAIANKVKAKFYDEDLPSLQNQFQDLQTLLIQRSTKILLHSQALQMAHLDTTKSRVAAVEQKWQSVDASKDQDLYIEHNVRLFNAPADWAFEPCSSHYDTSEMSVEGTSKVFLQNKLSRCRAKLAELDPVISHKRRELDQLTKLVTAYTADHSLGSLEEVSDTYLETKKQVTFYATSERILTAEMDTIAAALGDDEGSNQPHVFKSSSFSIPTQCVYCKSSIWGLSKQGKSCKLCGISVHSKCELKVPADCAKSEGGGSFMMRSASKSSRSSTNTSAGSASASTPSSFVTSRVSEEVEEETHAVAKMLFDFEPTSEFELEISEGTMVHVLEADDGSGWVKVGNIQTGKSGLVPASYVELSDQDGDGLGVIPETSQGSGKYVQAIYAYQAQGSDELALGDGEKIELTPGPTGGEHYGDGWWEGINARGQKGIFPSNYVTQL